ncbi:MAG: polymer-forming cytoskeletal protein [Treponema sp.]|nr:polymer-forming cytoskeletal protein [Treponema sp.]
MALRTDDISINTLIGLGSAISGDVHGNGFVRIDGDIDGNFETDGKVIIGEKSRIRGNVTAKSAIICGLIIGDVTAEESIHLCSTSMVIGDVITRSLEIEDHVVINGYCISIDSEDYQDRVKKRLDEKAIRSKAIHT